MTHVSTPNIGTLPRQRTSKKGSLGAAALVVAIGAALAFGITATTDEVVPASPFVNTFTAQREGSAPATVNGADRGYLHPGTERSVEEAKKQAAKQGQIPAQGFQPSAGYAEQPGQPR